MNIITLQKYPDLQFFDCEQNSEEWISARAGSFGSSDMKALYTKGTGKTRKSAIERKVREAHTGTMESWGESSATRWGHQYESEARSWFSMVTGLQVVTVGMVINNKIPGTHTSPDGLIFAKDGLYWLEIKCLQWKASCKYRKMAGDAGWTQPAEYRHQSVHHSVVTGAAGGFFLLYYPADRLHDDQEWVNIIRVIKRPDTAEREEHLQIICDAIAEYKSALPNAEKMILAKERERSSKNRMVAASIDVIKNVNQSIIEGIR